MAAAIVAAKQGKTSGDSADDHHIHRTQIRVNDPVELRTCTVDEAFRRMEELVGSEEEEKNWKGIVIALAVIAFILGMIALAIVLVSPAPEIYDPGEPLPFSVLTDQRLKIREPSFNWVRGSDQYVLYVQQEVNSTGDTFIERYVTLVDAAEKGNESESILIPRAVISIKLRGAEVVTASPDTNYALVRLDSETNSIVTKATYLIYDRFKPFVLKFSEKKLQYATWIGFNNELVYIQDNNIYYKRSVEDEPMKVTTDGSPALLNALPDATYKVYIFPDKDSLLWPSPFDSKFLFAKLDKSTVIPYSTKSSADNMKLGENDTGLLTLNVFDQGNQGTRELNISASPGYLTAVTWMDKDHVLVVWLSRDHQTEQYIICSCLTAQCHVNFEYKSSANALNWVGLYGTPIYNSMMNEYYTLLPDPANENKLYRHVAAIKVNLTERQDPVVTFLTSHQWSDLEILGLNGSRLFFLSTGTNFTHQHLYSLNTMTRASKCISCGIPITTMGERVTYVEARFSYTYSYLYLSVLGPGIPTFHVLKTPSHRSDELNPTKIDEEHYMALVDTYKDIHLPKVEFLTVPLDYGAEASVKLILPSIFNREKACLYEMLILINDIPGGRIATQKFSLGFQEYLAKNQTYIIALVDVRGAGGRGEKLRQSIYRGLGAAEARDIGNITSFLVAHEDSYKVDKAYIAVMGKGYGGFISMHTATNEDHKCVIASAPITSLSTYGKWLTDRYMPSGDVGTELNYDCVDTAQCSLPEADHVLLIHGTDDAVVPVENSLELMRDLQVAGYSFGQQLYPGVGHSPETSEIAPHYYQTISNYLRDCFEVRHRIDESEIDFCANREIV